MLPLKRPPRADAGRGASRRRGAALERREPLAHACGAFVLRIQAQVELVFGAGAGGVAGAFPAEADQFLRLLGQRIRWQQEQLVQVGDRVFVVACGERIARPLHQFRGARLDLGRGDDPGRGRGGWRGIGCRCRGGLGRRLRRGRRGDRMRRGTGEDDVDRPARRPLADRDRRGRRQLQDERLHAAALAAGVAQREFGDGAAAGQAPGFTGGLVEDGLVGSHQLPGDLVQRGGGRGRLLQEAHRRIERDPGDDVVVLPE